MCVTGRLLSEGPLLPQQLPPPLSWPLRLFAFQNHTGMRFPITSSQTQFRLLRNTGKGTEADGGAPGSSQAGCRHGVNLGAHDSLSTTHTFVPVCTADCLTRARNQQTQADTLPSSSPSPGSVASCVSMAEAIPVTIPRKGL